jgi:zinc transport system substrate-binding protein
MIPFQKLCLILYTVFVLAGFFFPASVQAKGPLNVAVSILPQKYFLEKIGGSLVNISVMVERGANPHTYEPKPFQMVALAETSVYFAIGVAFEEVWLKRISEMNPLMTIVHTDKGIRKRPMDTYGVHDLNGHNNSERNIIFDPHVWTSPPNVKILARNILNALMTADPAHKSAYSTNYKRFIDDIDELDSEFRSIFSGKEGLEFMVFHPAWGYFAEAYGIKQVPVEIEGKEPKPAQLKHLIMHAKERGIKVIFIQPQISFKSAETIARAIGGKVVPADPLAEDWMEGLRDQAENFRAALR